MDFVLRDAYMSGYSQRSFDLDRLLHYSFFTAEGLTIHDRGLNALMRFMAARAELFRSIYFHRTVRAVDLTLADLFADSHDLIFPGNPLEHLDQYLELTESSLLVDVSRWHRSADRRTRELGVRWRQLLLRQIPWKMVVQRTQVFDEGRTEQSSIFSDRRFVEEKLRAELPAALRDLPLRGHCASHRAAARPWPQQRAELPLRFRPRRSAATEARMSYFRACPRASGFAAFMLAADNTRRSWHGQSTRSSAVAWTIRPTCRGTDPPCRRPRKLPCRSPQEGLVIMSHDCYENPLITRYASTAMARIWGDQRKHSTWRRLWVALAEAEQELGLDIRDSQLEEMRPLGGPDRFRRWRSSTNADCGTT